MSKGWIIAGVVFFFLSCFFGGWVMVALQGRDGTRELEKPFVPRDAGSFLLRACASTR